MIEGRDTVRARLPEMVSWFQALHDRADCGGARCSERDLSAPGRRQLCTARRNKGAWLVIAGSGTVISTRSAVKRSPKPSTGSAARGCSTTGLKTGDRRQRPTTMIAVTRGPLTPVLPPGRLTCEHQSDQDCRRSLERRRSDWSTHRLILAPAQCGLSSDFDGGGRNTISCRPSFHSCKVTHRDQLGRLPWGGTTRTASGWLSLCYGWRRASLDVTPSATHGRKPSSELLCPRRGVCARPTPTARAGFVWRVCAALRAARHLAIRASCPAPSARACPPSTGPRAATGTRALRTTLVRPVRAPGRHGLLPGT